MEKVKGTQEIVEPIEVGKTTVYIRTNITRIDTNDFIGWEYNEEQMPINEFISLLRVENDNIKTDMNNAIMELSVLIAMGGSI